MTTIATTIGDQVAVILERSAADELGIEPGSRLEMSIERGEIRIRLADDGRRDLVLESARKMMDIHDETFRKLAE